MSTKILKKDVWKWILEQLETIVMHKLSKSLVCTDNFEAKVTVL